MVTGATQNVSSSAVSRELSSLNAKFLAIGKHGSVSDAATAEELSRLKEQQSKLSQLLSTINHKAIGKRI